jgi:hypothetical protein
MKCTGTLSILVAVALLATLALAGPAAAAPGGSSGATLQADKTIEICDNGDGTWTYSGAVSVWNTGTTDATACQITDVIETKNVSGPNWTTACTALLNASCGNLSAIVPGETPEGSAFVTTYSCDAPAATTTVRNNANVTIANHSGGRANGPNPKATYFGPVPPPTCALDCGCALTQGYWKNHTDDPAWSTADLSAFGGATNALEILKTEPQGGNKWYILAHQYIAYLLNVANGACTPKGLQTIVTNAGNFFAGHTDPAACQPVKGVDPCNVSVGDACILDVYNHGEYPEGPLHCEEAAPSDKICIGLP